MDEDGTETPETIRVAGSSSDVSDVETQLYPRRWWLLLNIGVENFIFTASVLHFGVINDILLEYFDLPFAATDWFYLVCRPLICLTCADFACLVFLNKSGSRKVSITCGSFMVFGYLCQILSYVYPRFYLLVYVNNYFLGTMSYCCV